MKRIHYILMLGCALTLVACNGGGGGGVDFVVDPPSNSIGGGKIKFTKTRIITKDTDFKGATLEWHGKDKGKCDQAEGRPYMFVVNNNATVKNFNISTKYPSPDGIRIKHGSIENFYIPRTCEDALSKVGDGRGVVRNGVLGSNKYRAEDKILQWNDDGDLWVYNTVFINGGKGIRRNGGTPKNSDPSVFLKVVDCTFVNCDKAIKADPKKKKGLKMDIWRPVFKGNGSNIVTNKNVEVNLYNRASIK